MLLDKLNKQIDYTLSLSRFYQNKIYKNWKLKHIDEFLEFPITNKIELLKDQEDFPPFGSNLCIDVEKIQRIHKTSGTSNKPLIIALTEKDIKTTVEVGAKCFESAGLLKNDIVIHCLNYNMWAGGYTDHQSLEKTGAAVIPFGVGNSHNLIESIILLKPTSIHCTPSYLNKLELILQNDFQLLPRRLGLRLGLFGAESGLQNPSFRQRIEETWGLKAMNANYGLSDVLSMIGAECESQNGLHFYGSEVLYPELIDPKTLEKIEIEPGSIGELVLSNLDKEAQPLLRYKTNDVIKILSEGKCQCGYEGFTFEVIGRSDDMIIIKGVNVFINSIEKLLSEYSEINSGVFKVCVNKVDPIDKIQIYAEIKNNNTDLENLKTIIIKRIQRDLNFRPEVYLLKQGQLTRTEGKAKKLFRTL